MKKEFWYIFFIIFLTGVLITMARTENYFNVYDGLDTRKSIGLKNQHGLAVAKNIDFLGKSARRAKGQEEKFQITDESILGLAGQEIDGLEYMRAITDAGKYYRVASDWSYTEVSGDAKDIDEASYDSKSYTPGGQIYGGSCLNSDGSKLYEIRDDGKIYQHSLSIPHDISTASNDDKSFDITGQISYNQTRGLFIDSTDEKFYVISYGANDIHQYTLDANDISNSNYDNKSFNVTSECTSPRAMSINSAKTKMWIMGGYASSNKIHQYSISDGTDISTASSDDKSITLELIEIADAFSGMWFNPDTSKVFVVSSSETNDRVYQYLISDADDITTASYDGKYFIISEDGVPNSLFFKPDLSKMYVLGILNDTIYQYSLPSSFSISTSSIPYFFSGNKNNLIIITTKDDPFIDNGTAISQTGLYTAKSVYGSVGCAAFGRILIASGNTLYWSAAGTLNDWTTAKDAGYDSNFDGEIIGIENFTSYVVIRTRSSFTIMAGSDPSNFTFDRNFSGIETFSRFAASELDDKIYVFARGGLFPLEKTGTLYQGRFDEPLSYKISDTIKDELDIDRLDEIIVLGYENRKQIWCYLPITGQAGLYKAFILNFINIEETKEAWTIREGGAITCACKFKGGIYSGNSAGKVFEEDSSDLFDAAAIVSDFKTNTMLLGTLKEKICYKFKALFNKAYLNKCDFKFIYNGETDNVYTESVDLTSHKQANDAIIKEDIPLRGYFDTIQIQITTDASLHDDKDDEDYNFYGGTFEKLRNIN